MSTLYCQAIPTAYRKLCKLNDFFFFGSSLYSHYLKDSTAILNM